MNTEKQLLVQACIALAEQKVIQYLNEIDLLKESIEKSDAKDDEGSDGQRETLQQQIGQNYQRLNEARQTLDIYRNIKLNLLSSQIQRGSLVKTSVGNFLISSSLGKISIGTNQYYAVSEASLIGELLLGKKVQDQFILNGKDIRILEVH